MHKILAIGDAGCHTGFSRVLKGIMDHLYGTGKYDVAVRAINYLPNHGQHYDYEVLPIRDPKNDDPLGTEDFLQHVEDLQPDVLWIVQDLWNLGNYLIRKPRELPSVVYFPVDCPNLKWGHSLCLGTVNEAVSYTEFGAHEAAASIRDGLDMLRSITENGGVAPDHKATWVQVPAGSKQVMSVRIDTLARLQNPGNWNVVPHGLDLEAFGPRDRTECRALFGVPQDAFVLGCVSTNQFRKRLDITIRAFAYVAERIPNAVLVMHCMGAARMGGWDLEQLVQYYGVANRALFVHKLVPVLTEEGLNNLYNCFDAHINTSGGEAWSLCNLESAACGTPQLVPDWSGTREIWKDKGILLPVMDYRAEPKGINTMHALVDVQQAGEQIVALARNPDQRAYWGQLALENCAKQLPWWQVGNAFDQLIQRALNAPPPLPMSFDDIFATRLGECKSELAGVPVFHPMA